MLLGAISLEQALTRVDLDTLTASVRDDDPQHESPACFSSSSSPTA
jgi:hypothetical protein